MQAKMAANEERGTMEAWDPVGTADLDAESCRRDLLMSDRGGYLREARSAAERAARLARNAEELGRVAEMRVLLAYGAGDDVEAVRQASILVALEPESERSRQILRCVSRRAMRGPARPPSTLEQGTGDRNAMQEKVLQDRRVPARSAEGAAPDGAVALDGGSR
jgi:hypothetical protein